MSLNESIVEEAALEWFGELGYAIGHGPHLAPGEPEGERTYVKYRALLDVSPRTVDADFEKVAQELKKLPRPNETHAEARRTRREKT